MKRALLLFAVSGCSPAMTPIPDAGPPPAGPADEVAVGGAHACARMHDGKLRCWGTVSDAGLSPDHKPVVVATASNAAQLALGADFGCVRFSAGNVQCWGAGDKGQLGDGDAGDSPDLVDVVGVSNAVELSAGNAHACARLMDHSVTCWGNNARGQLGDGSADAFKSVPVQLGTTLSAAQLACGLEHACVVRVSGSTVCWGANDLGQLGDGSTLDRPTPVSVIGAGSGTQVSAGLTTCLRRDDDTVACWGVAPGLPYQNVTALPDFGTVDALSVGAGFLCAREADGGAIACAGTDENGELGDGTNVSRSDAGVVPALHGVTQLAAGTGFACALLVDGGVSCWGANSAGQLGDGTTGSRTTPGPVTF